MTSHEQQHVIIQSIEDLKLPLLQSALGDSHITNFTSERIGTGLVGEVHRVSLVHNEPDESSRETVIVKIASQDPRSRASGLSLGIYEREVRFYAELSEHLQQEGADCLARCFHHAFDAKTGAFTLLLEDAGISAHVGNDLTGATLEQARLAVFELGRLHSPFLRDPSLLADRASWLIREAPITQALLQQLFAGFSQRYKDRVAPDHMGICAKFVSSFDGYAKVVKENSVMGMIHGDFRLDNHLFTDRRHPLQGETGIMVVDWQTVTAGPILGDVAYFLGCSIESELRREWQDILLQTYCDALGEVDGDPVLTLERCKADLRLQAFFGVSMAVISSMMTEATERGDEMFMTMLGRHCELIKDLDSISLLPEPTNDAPLRPKAEDEYRHSPGTEPLWNESYYFDFIDEEQRIAGWVRIGLTPNQRGNWYIAALTRTGKPTVLVRNFLAPAPKEDSSLAIETTTIRSKHNVIEPLKQFDVSLEGLGESFEDSSDPLQGKTGQDCRLALDLQFHTSGVPYQYRITTRYEIPCSVSGSVVVGDEKAIAFKGIPGQRDHSWGVRDWWSMDWVWSAFHIPILNQSIHAVELRVPGRPRMGIGYLQQAGAVLEIEKVEGSEEYESNGLVKEASLAIQAKGMPEIKVRITPQGHAGLQLVSEDGRVSMFERAWAVVEGLGDGNKAVGWFEWNRNGDTAK